MKRNHNPIHQGLLDLGVCGMVARQRLEGDTMGIVQAFDIPPCVINELPRDYLGSSRGTLIHESRGKGPIYLTVDGVLRLGMDLKG